VFPHQRVLPCSLASPCTRLSRARSTTKGSDFHRSICLPMDGPFRWHTRHHAKTTMDLPGSSDASLSTRAVPLDPAGLSSSPRHFGCLLMAFHVFERVGFRSFITRLIWLHLRYGPSVALSTLNPYRYLHEFKTRFPVGWLSPCRGGNCTRWKRRVYPGAPKHFSISSSKIFPENLVAMDRVCKKISCVASQADLPGLKP
jgi:hypothetical protein